MGESVNRVAFLWDESFLWGLMAYKALKANNLPFELIRSEDIKRGQLKNYKMLFVPGGWASNKLKTLGDTGINEIKKFVNNSGNYLGFCGGAGLATLDGIGLLNIKRMPTKQRVPSFSGRIHLKINTHPIFADSPIHPFTHSPIFHAWWPSQFLINDKKIKTLAAYGNALPDSFSSDLNVGDVESNGRWAQMEKVYGINLNPKRLLNEPAVVEGRYGKGKVILSLIHFDTPDDENGAKVLRNLWRYLNTGCRIQDTRCKQHPPQSPLDKGGIKGGYHASCIVHHASLLPDLEAAVEELIALGSRNFLWFWRNPMLLQWRRGVRGLEYCTLYGMIKELSAVSTQLSAGEKVKLQEIKKLLLPFAKKAKRLLILERHAMQNGHITPLSPPLVRGGWGGEVTSEIQKIRTELFGDSKSHGGLFKELIDEIDSVLYLLLHLRADSVKHL